ncbi:hypothetical protein QFW82_23675 [Streptomyces malaysiensis subsp. malaysiensis]|uniref:hypothetical protein n=1 Tax=Streptomyces malaysiensis TaxID=92644 RepID=UPI0024C0392E|nr:hypothetical protein [Streptomyces sp. NA07423]WHX19832.1 hypothetical protein QFW82_23675 [Streptomyces sp. NA07423]
MTTYLSAEAILNAQDLPTEDVEVPEWGGTVRVRAMSGTELDRFESGFLGNDMKQLPKDKALEHYRARLAAACVIDGDGNRLFRSAAEVKRLGEKNAKALRRVCDAAMRLSGMSEEGQKELTGN